MGQDKPGRGATGGVGLPSSKGLGVGRSPEKGCPECLGVAERRRKGGVRVKSRFGPAAPRAGAVLIGNCFRKYLNTESNPKVKARATPPTNPRGV